jgi:hypothetical protein
MAKSRGEDQSSTTSRCDFPYQRLQQEYATARAKQAYVQDLAAGVDAIMDMASNQVLTHSPRLASDASGPQSKNGHLLRCLARNHASTFSLLKNVIFK